MERAYTVSEIDALRSACKMRWLFGTTSQVGGGVSRSYMAEEMNAGVEELVRTHMLAGHTAQDIYEADRVST